MGFEEDRASGTRFAEVQDHELRIGRADQVTLGELVEGLEHANATEITRVLGTDAKATVNYK